MVGADTSGDGNLEVLALAQTLGGEVTGVEAVRLLWLAVGTEMFTSRCRRSLCGEFASALFLKVQGESFKMPKVFFLCYQAKLTEW